MTARESTIMAHEWCRMMNRCHRYKYNAHDAMGVWYDRLVPFGWSTCIRPWPDVRRELKAAGFPAYE